MPTVMPLQPLINMFLFSTIDHLNENLDLLQHFVADTAFTDESIEREKSIISQEIDMYQDDADYHFIKDS
ncbi:insulinase family protein [Streptococcus lutetiensis]|uniref:insulinase family protein n=1 Tax=Streptococcus lutetiensis TaxID=150055 RepID=UPI001F541995|nr:insulinase family protein [Streptococcus lutetiensis]